MRWWVLSALVLTAFAAAPSPSRAEPSLVGRDLLGCWEKNWQKPKSKWSSRVTFCFKHSDELYGRAFDDGDMWDWSEKWLLRSLTQLDVQKHRCGVTLDKPEKLLTLQDCPVAGEYHWSSIQEQ